jgi:uncharacterized protein (DUF1810 family)
MSAQLAPSTRSARSTQSNQSNQSNQSPQTNGASGATDPFFLQRFVEAQQSIYQQALSELQSGKKKSHWMWFIFPQMAGLGKTSTAQHYGIKSLAEAEAYLADPVLGARLNACTEAVLALDDCSTSQIFGSPDDMKFHSCMTLFARAAGPNSPFQAALARFCGGQADPRTLALLPG